MQNVLCGPVNKFPYKQSHYLEDNPPNSLYCEYLSIVYLPIILFAFHLMLSETKSEPNKSLTFSLDLAACKI